MTLTCCESEDAVAKTLCRNTAYIEMSVNLQNLSVSLGGIEPIKSEKFMVFSLGRICLQKQLQVFNRIDELVPEASFLWIGYRELRDQLTVLDIEITGWKQRHEALVMAKGQRYLYVVLLGK